MSITADIATTDLQEIYADAVAAADGPLYALNPTVDALITLTRTLYDRDPEDAEVTVVARTERLRDLGDEFVVRTLLADCIERGSVTLYGVEFDDDVQPNLLVSPNATTSVVSAGRLWSGLRTEDETLAAELIETAERLVEGASEYDLRTPGISRLRDTLADGLGSNCQADFSRALSRLRTDQGSAERLDEAVLLLLVAAKNDAMFYDLGKWVEEIGLLSKATLSRKKSALEERGIVATENVPIEVGRPRHRLRLVDDRLREADAGELSSVALNVSAT